MLFMCTAKRFFRYSVPVFVLLALLTAGVTAQTKKKPAPKKSPAKTTAKKTPQTKKKETAAKSTTAKKTATKKAAATKTSTKNSSKKAKKPTAAERRAELARKKKEEERKQAALQAQRRKEQAAREARERKLAFERGLRTATVANISAEDPAGEDLAIRRAAISALGTRAGTVVVMEAKTGRIVTMINHDWAIRDGFKPCSTIKLVTGVAGLNESLINVDGQILGDTMKLDLNDALAYSNNAYFQRVGVKMGTDKMIEYAKMLGLGQKTGINAAGESSGKLPYGNSNPRIYSHADDFEVTPLQLAVMVSALTNGGHRVVPYFSRTRVENAAMRTRYSGDIDLPAAKYQGVIPGMKGAAEYGTARRGVDAEMGVAGKTGSCIGKGTWVGLFASVAPVNDPKYAVVVITRGQNERGRYAAAIAGKIYEELQPMLPRPVRTMINSDVAVAPKTTIETLAAAIDEEEDDDAALLETAEGEETPAVNNGESRRRIIIGSAKDETPASTTAPKKVIKTSQSRPVFKPVIITVKKRPEEKPRPRVVKN